MAKEKKLKLTWRKDSGDGELTDDIYLWVNGKPTEICISGAEGGWYGVLYYGYKQLHIGDTRKELKDALFTEHPEVVEEVLKEYK